jgi:hypothetical protein
MRILDSPYYVFVALCIVVIVISLTKIARPRMKILNVFANILLLAIAHLTLAFFKSSCTGQDKK